MADVRGVNNMSVEVAVQRELAYRRKVAMLQSPSNSNFYRDIIPMEVKSSSSGPSPSPNPMPNSASTARLSGIKRKALTNSLELLTAPQPQELENRMDRFFCKVCQVPCSGYISFQQHIEGKKHKLKMRELKFCKKEKPYEVGNQRLWCGFCKIWCTNEYELKAHLEGQKHKNVLSKVESGWKNGGEITIAPNRCKLCNIVP
ncbi:hypothetical protein P3X46_023220 [Hevea brasiliensis]|uniref:C2H2-type domain-containing protein n=1 Tax=Hevea brasiliensis TaxID=3981 RepID=A0ABQ9LC41_HEVBR|nr:uncharacterized protein LOC110639195 isoform X1 [Hevea brasiliensis]XP_021645729.2 uncharacterized protein LOC110639195 isoform X1 [Hevea brasiliensis]XP_021645730.2 uncharacterized protein LOC110639195 isoform X1 [Hevea brasiliensis]XP_021645731.2 uncharacterized protein LOC110639195 isoform X1 [Hevea brasiliensis]XP_021645732.2 uncharacterized protein LOC110639195 isoform X1 [Hevea brasiliensis]XP_021645733.2 uncharacterized protein LOC110639195 isoform X1 [Hevea brasiliensis]KAJ9163569.